MAFRRVLLHMEEVWYESFFKVLCRCFKNPKESSTGLKREDGGLFVVLFSRMSNFSRRFRGFLDGLLMDDKSFKGYFIHRSGKRVDDGRRK